MNRREWTFSYIAGDVARAARARAGHHREREAWWQGQLEEADAKLRESAVVRHQAVSGGVRPEIVFDQEAQNRYSECERSVERHRVEAEQFEAFASVLEAHCADGLWLDVDDVRYFGLA